MDENNGLAADSLDKAKRKPGKPLFITLLIIGALLGGYYFYNYFFTRPEVFKPQPIPGVPMEKIAPLQGLYAPNFTLKDLNGRNVTLTDYRGKVVFINIWATWCPPCREEMPSMQKLYDRLQGQDFEILAISIDTEGAKVVGPFMREYGLTFPALLDPESKVGRLYKITGVPESFIVNKKGIIVRKIIGPLDWSSQSSFSFFDRLLKE